MSAKLPVTVNLTAYRGDTWAQSFRFLNGTHPVDLSGSSVDAAMRDGGGRSSAMVVSVESEPGMVTIRFPVDVPPPGPYVYDVEVTDAADVTTTWVRGRLIVQQDVTNELP